MSLKMKSVTTVIFLGMLVGSVNVFGQESIYRGGTNSDDLALKCSDLQPQITAANAICQQAYSDGIISADDKNSLALCQSSLSCSGLFEKPSSDDTPAADSDEGKALAEEQAAIDKIVGQNPFYAPPAPNFTLTTKKPIAKCSSLGVQMRLDSLYAGESDAMKDLNEDNQKLLKASEKIDKSKADIQANMAQTTATIQNATLDQKNAESRIQAEIAKGDQDTVLNYQGIQEKIDDNNTKIMSLSSGADFLAIQNQYSSDLAAALAACENNMRSMTLNPATGLPTKNITIPGGGLNGLLSMAQCGGTTSQASSNPFSNNGCVTRNYCAANNTYIMAQAAAYNKYLAGLASLSSSRQVLIHQNNTLLAQQTQLLASNGTNRLFKTQSLTTEIAKDQMAIANANTQLNSQMALAQNAEGAMGGNLQSLAATQNRDAIRFAQNKFQFDTLQASYPNLQPNMKDNAAKTDADMLAVIAKGVGASATYNSPMCGNGSGTPPATNPRTPAGSSAPSSNNNGGCNPVSNPFGCGGSTN